LLEDAFIAQVPEAPHEDYERLGSLQRFGAGTISRGLELVSKDLSVGGWPSGRSRRAYIPYLA
jgi:hypothetical protein